MTCERLYGGLAPSSKTYHLRQIEIEESLKNQAAVLKRDEQALFEEKSRLEAQKGLFVRELKRVRDEERNPVLVLKQR